MKKTIKKIISVLLTVVLCLSVSPIVFASYRGDVNYDGTTNSYDALLILRCAVGVVDEEMDPYWADLNGDEVINSSDALYVLRISVGSDKPENYTTQEILKFYADALYSTYFSTVKVDYTLNMSGYYGYFVDEYDYAREPFEAETTETAFFENGYDSEGYTPYDYYAEPWISPEAVSSATIVKKDNEYIVRINMLEERVTPEEPLAEDTYLATGFYFDFGDPEYNEVWSEGGQLVLPNTVIIAHINADGFVTSYCTEVPFAGETYLTDGYDRMHTDIDGLYTADIKFYF